MSYIANLGLQLGTQLGSQAVNQIGYGLGEVTGYNDKLRKDQLEQQQKLTDIQVNAEKEMFDYTSPKKRVQQLEEAGLNPALAYSNSGMAGSTIPSIGSGSASDEASQRNSNTQANMLGVQLMNNILQQQAVKADIGLKQSQANLNNTQANNNVVTKDLILANTANMLQDTKNKMDYNKAIVLDNSMRQIDLLIKENTEGAQENLIKYNANIAKENFESIMRSNEIGEATKKAVEQSYYNNVALQVANYLDTLATIGLKKAETTTEGYKQKNLAQTNAVMQSQIGVNNATIANINVNTEKQSTENYAIGQKVVQEWKRLGYEGAQLELNKYSTKRGLDIQQQKVVVDGVTGLLKAF